MAFIDSIKKRAKQNKKTIVLPETPDMRTLEAAHKILQEGIADIILVGDKQTIIKKADGLDLTGAKFVDPYDCDKLNDYVSILVELRKKKGMTPEEAKAHRPSVVFVDEINRIDRVTNYEKHGQLFDKARLDEE